MPCLPLTDMLPLVVIRHSRNTVLMVDISSRHTRMVSSNNMPQTLSCPVPQDMLRLATAITSRLTFTKTNEILKSLAATRVSSDFI